MYISAGCTAAQQNAQVALTQRMWKEMDYFWTQHANKEGGAAVYSVLVYVGEEKKKKAALTETSY